MRSQKDGTWDWLGKEPEISMRSLRGGVWDWLREENRTGTSSWVGKRQEWNMGMLQGLGKKESNFGEGWESRRVDAC